MACLTILLGKRSTFMSQIRSPKSTKICIWSGPFVPTKTVFFSGCFTKKKYDAIFKPVSCPEILIENHSCQPMKYLNFEHQLYFPCLAPVTTWFCWSRCPAAGLSPCPAPRQSSFSPRHSISPLL